MVDQLAEIALILAAVPCLLYVRNSMLFQPPPQPVTGSLVVSPRVSVLIPARNEERSIAGCLESVLASTGVELEVVVLDDDSTDRTALIVTDIAAKDGRVTLRQAPPLPDGWAGKQHACAILAQHARYDTFAFLDADVRLQPEALARMMAFLRRSGTGLVSGFPRQETVTILERLLIPMIHFLLLGYLPMDRMRRTTRVGYGAGCGQLMLATRAAYTAVGGHAAVRSSFHDGVTLPRAFRRAGLRTDICDATGLAVCRMYRSAGEVWRGLAKNAGEGLGSALMIVPITCLLFGGQVLPFVLLIWAATGAAMSAKALEYTEFAAVLAIAPRLDAARRYRLSWVGAVLHPIGICLLLAIQWYALIRRLMGKPVGWKGRPPARVQLL